MTVLVGIRCVDGVVIGSDSARTSGTEQGQKTTVHLGPKIDIVDDKVIIAHTGQVGMAQRFTDVITTQWKAGKFHGKNSLDIARLMSALAGNDFAATKAHVKQYGALVGYRTGKDGPTLCEFAVADFQPELKTKTWYCSMGIGQTVVDPLLGLFRKAFWHTGAPKLPGGIFAATLALELAIELCPSGVKEPIKLAVLDKAKARFLDDGELDGHRENAKQAVTHLGDYPETLLQPAAPGVPKPNT